MSRRMLRMTARLAFDPTEASAETVADHLDHIVAEMFESAKKRFGNFIVETLIFTPMPVKEGTLIHIAFAASPEDVDEDWGDDDEDEGDDGEEDDPEDDPDPLPGLRWIPQGKHWEN